jgi:hypothetical protein
MEIYLWCFLKILYYLFIEVIFEGSYFELEKSVFEVNIFAPFEQ